MADTEKLKGKLSLYLSTLSDNAQQLLLKTLEKGAADGSNDAAADLIHAALRSVLDEKAPKIPLQDKLREGTFRSCQPFLAPVDLTAKVPARISPGSLEAIWQWAKRDIMSEEQKAMMEEMVGALTPKELKQKVEIFRDDLLAAIRNYVNPILKEMGGDQKLSNQLGSQLILADLHEFLQCDQQAAELRPTLMRLPAELSSWTGPEGEEAFAIITRYVQSAPLKAAWLFSAVAPRLKQPRMRVQMSTKLAGSDDCVQVAATVYAPAVQHMLAEMDAYVALFCSSLSAHGQLPQSIDALTKWHEFAKVLNSELEISLQSPWGKAITKMKTEISGLLEKEIDPVPGLIRQALRAPKEGGAEVAEESMLQDATRAAELFHHAERMKSSLAINEPVNRIRKELDQTFEILTTSLVNRTRHAEGADVFTCQTLGDAASIFAEHLFDVDYANAFRRQLRAAASTQDVKAVAS